MFDCRMLDWGGVGTYTRNLLRAMLDTERDLHIKCLIHPSQEDALGSLIGGNTRAEPFLTDLPALSLPGLFKIGRVINGAGVDIFHSPHFPYPAFLSIPGVVTIHDIIPMICPGAVEWQTKIKYIPLIRVAARKAAKIISVSNSTARDLKRHLKVDPKKITVIHEAVDKDIMELASAPDQGGAYLDLPLNFLLYVGVMKPHKNIEGVIRAYAELPAQVRSDHPLVMVGRDDRRYFDVDRTAEELGIRGDLRRIQDVSVEALAELYRRATLLLIPSFYEGFGLPSLEAMAFGTPVIASNRSSFPELIEGCARLVDPNNVGEISSAILELVEDAPLRTRLGEAGKARAASFSWQKAAEATLDVYAEVLNKQLKI